MAKKDKDGPVHRARLSALQLAVWANEHTPEDGETRVFHTVTLERNYKDKNDEWQKTSQLRESDIDEAIALSHNVQQFLVKEEQ